MLVKLDCYTIDEMITHMKNEQWPHHFKGVGITVDSIRRYKGLEAKVVIVVVPEETKGQQCRTMNYFMLPCQGVTVN